MKQKTKEKERERQRERENTTSNDGSNKQWNKHTAKLDSRPPLPGPQKVNTPSPKHHFAICIAGKIVKRLRTNKQVQNQTSVDTCTLSNETER